jgi:hypothetical protein
MVTTGTVAHSVPQDHLSIEMIRDDLVTEVVGRHTYLFGHVPSIASVLRRLFASGAADGTVVLTESQTVATPPAWWRALEGSLTVHAGVLLRRVEDLDATRVRVAGVLALADAIWATRTPVTVSDDAELSTGGRTVAAARVEDERARPEPFMVLLFDVALPPDHGGLDRNGFVAHLLSGVDRWLSVLRKDPVGFADAWQELQESRAAPAA